MSKILAVFGATGQQGGSIVDTVLNDAQLSKDFKVRGITRDLSSPAAKALQARGIEVVQGDSDVPSSLVSALKGAHTVFAVTVTIYDNQTLTRETRQGRAIADAAVSSGAEYLIFSTLSHIGRESKGKITDGDSFDGKAEIEEYIRTLPIKSAFFAPGGFMQNFSSNMGPRLAGDGTYRIANFVAPSTKTPLIDISGDTGKFVAAILKDPAGLEGKVLSAATKLYSYNEIAEIMTKESGKTVSYVQVPKEVYQSFLPQGPMSVQLVAMWQFMQDFGYYGEGTEEKVKWAASKAVGKLATLEDYFQRYPLNLD